MTLTEKDIEKARDLYAKLTRLHEDREAVRNLKFDVTVSGYGIEKAQPNGQRAGHCSFRDFSLETIEEIREAVARDIRRRTAAVVAELNKLGCEAKLTPEKAKLTVDS